MDPSTSSSAASSPSSHLILFARSVMALIDGWPTMRLAVNEEWGGISSREKKTWLVSTIVDSFQDAPQDEFDLEDLLLDTMLEEFNAEIEDGSCLLLAKAICKAWAAAQGGDLQHVLDLETHTARSAGRNVAVNRSDTTIPDDGDEEPDDITSDEEDEEGDSDHAMDLDGTRDDKQESSRPAPVVDDDGFTLVQKGRKRS